MWLGGQAVINVDDYGASAQALAATTLRNVLGTRSLGEILSDRVKIATEIYELLVEGTQDWGVTVERVEVSVVMNSKNWPNTEDQIYLASENVANIY